MIRLCMQAYNCQTERADVMVYVSCRWVAIALLRCVFHVNAHDFLTPFHGTVNVQGEVLSNACAMSTSTTSNSDASGYQVIEMPDVSRGALSRTGEGPPQLFSLFLSKCALSATAQAIPWTFLRVTFEGTDENGLFKLSGDVLGLALKITDRDGHIISNGEKTPYVSKSPDQIELDYAIRLIKTSNNFKAGNYSSIIRYHVEYF